MLALPEMFTKKEVKDYVENKHYTKILKITRELLKGIPENSEREN